nr:phosphatase PAP2 family protein [Tissierella sp.]
MKLLKGFDDLFIKLINGRMSNKFLDYFMYRVTDLGGAIFTSVFSLAIIIFGNNATRFMGLEAIVALGISQTIVQILKRSFGRQRPYNMIKNINTFEIELKDFSFPSGHTTASFCMAATLSLNMPRIAIFLYIMAMIIGISRIYLAVHYPTDVLVGIVLGIGSALIVHIFLLDYVMNVAKWFSLL